jgi:hypothetical protein
VVRKTTHRSGRDLAALCERIPRSSLEIKIVRPADRPLRYLRKADFNIGIRARPYKRKACCPILAVDSFARPGVLLRRQNASYRRKLRSSHFPANGARRHAHLWIIANPLCLPHVTARHHVKFPVFLAKPHRRSDSRGGFAKRREGNIFLTLNGCGNWTGHTTYFRRWHGLVAPANAKARCLRDSRQDAGATTRLRAP